MYACKIGAQVRGIEVPTQTWKWGHCDGVQPEKTVVLLWTCGIFYNVFNGEYDETIFFVALRMAWGIKNDIMVV